MVFNLISLLLSRPPPRSPLFQEVHQITETCLTVDLAASGTQKAERRRIRHGLCVSVGGHQEWRSPADLGLKTNASGRIHVDDTLQVIAQTSPAFEHLAAPVDGVFAIGDCAGELPMTADVALQQGNFVADALNGMVDDRAILQRRPFQYEHEPGTPDLACIDGKGQIPVVGIASSAPLWNLMTAFHQ